MRKPPLDLIKHALEEDGAEYDITTLSTVPEEHLAHASLIGRQNGVVAGLSVAAATFQLLDERIVINLLVQDGDTVHSDQVLAHLEGPARSLLSAERVALNFLGHLSGIATVTARCVRAVEGTPARVLDTRKTTPGLRSLEKDAVLLGGGKNHRFGLSDGVLHLNLEKMTARMLPADSKTAKMWKKRQAAKLQRDEAKLAKAATKKAEAK